MSQRRSFICSVCGETFNGPETLTVHLKQRHTNNLHRNRAYESGNFECSKIPKEESCYKCKQCGKTFTQYGNLTTHLRTHSGERPYECKQCGKTFTKHESLTKHLSNHKKQLKFYWHFWDFFFWNVARFRNFILEVNSH